MISNRLLQILAFILMFHRVLGNEADKPENRLKLATSDTAKVMVYNSFARNCMTAQNRDYNKALQYAKQGLMLAMQTNFDKGCAELQCTTGVAYYYLDDYDKAIEHYNEAIVFCKKTGDIDGVAKNYYNISIIYRTQTKYFNSFKFQQEALLLWKQTERTDRIIIVSKSIISLLRSVNEPYLAMNYAKEALNMAVETGNRYEEAALYDILAQIYHSVGNVKLMKEYYQKSIKIFEELDNQIQIARVTHNYANDTYTDNPEMTVALMQKSAVIYEKLTSNNTALFEIYNDISKQFQKENIIDSVRYYKEKALSKAILSGSTQRIAEAYIATGTFYMNSGNIKRAETDFRKACEIAVKMKLNDRRAEALSGLSTVNYYKGDYKTSAKYMKEHKKIADSLHLEEIKRNIQQVNAHFEFEKDINEQTAVFNMQIENQQQAIEYHKTIMKIIFIAFIISTIFLFIIIRNNQHNRQTNIKLEQQHAEILRINGELQKSHIELSRYKDGLEEMVREQTDMIHRSEIQLHTISNNLPGGCIYQKHVHSDGTQIISYMGSKAEKLFGIGAEKIMTDISHFHNLIIPEDLERKQSIEKESIMSMSPYSCEFRMKRDKGTVWMLENAMPRHDKNSVIVWDGIIVDITDRKNFESELIREKEHAEESDRLKSAFLANMSHEIRTPINGITGFLQMLGSDSISEENRRECIGEINHSCSQLMKQIENIIDLAKLESKQMTVEPQPVPVNGLMQEIHAHFEQYLRSGAISKRLTLIMDESGFTDRCIASIDPLLLRQALGCLIDNAIKFTEKGYVRFGYRQLTGDMLEFFVEDTGIGFAPEIKNVIFESFRQAELANNRMYGGNGLGLTISRNIVKLMGGEIYAESEEGTGSTFYIRLPRNYNPQDGVLQFKVV